MDVSPKSDRKRHSVWVEDDECLLGATGVGATEYIYALIAAVIALSTPYAHGTLKQRRLGRHALRATLRRALRSSMSEIEDALRNMYGKHNACYD